MPWMPDVPKGPVALVGLLAVTGGGCATVATTENPFESSRLDGGPSSYLVVENNNSAELQVYAVQGRARISLGRVSPVGSSRLEIPDNFVRAGAITLLAEERPRVRGATYRTREVVFSPGQNIEWKLEATLGRSFVAVRNP